jgi:hypothetical protein
MKRSSENGSTLLWMMSIPAVIFGSLLLLLGWMGLVPGLSDLMGTRNPVDLGVAFAPEDLENLKVHYASGLSVQEPPQKNPSETNATPTAPESEPTRLPQKKGESTLKISEQELSALANQSALKLLPLKKVQIRLSPETLEVSGALDQSSLDGFLKGIGVRDADAQRARAAIDALGNNLPVYLRLEGGVDQGQLNLHVDEIRVGNLPLPEALTEQITKGSIRANTGNKAGYSIQQLNIGQGTMEFQGAPPDQWGLSP